jgi:hypothetical protein
MFVKTPRREMFVKTPTREKSKERSDEGNVHPHEGN